ncbi:MAG: ribonuclease P protein component [Betaproteobacteria bacterium]|nr:ribonuclease P protein component [Betaproteobacteria bacterium]
MQALTHPTQFDAVFKSGRRTSSDHFVLHWLAGESAAGLRLGFILPKRLARRAARRNLIKRQWRTHCAAAERAGINGDAVVRLVKPFDRDAFRSPASPLLAHAVAAQAEQLLSRCNPGRPA